MADMTRLSAQVAGQLEREILAGKLPPGERLPSEERLCERFDTSRTVIREAIQQLRGRGMLRSLKGSGTFIAAPSLDSFGAAIAAYSALADESDFLDLIDCRILIETECARLAASNAGERTLARLERTIERMVEVRGDRPAFSKLDIAFHTTIARASGNQVYATLLEALERRCIDYAITNRGDDDWYDIVLTQHREILGTLESAHPEQAAATMRRHLLASRRHFVDLSEEDDDAATPLPDEKR